LSKNKNCDKEYDKVQKLAHENRELKRKINSLRKQLAKRDSQIEEFCPGIDEFEEISLESEAKEKDKKINELKKEWQCHECGKGFLEIVKYPRIGEIWYFRRCNNLSCGHRTASKPYTPDVKGILQENED